MKESIYTIPVNEIFETPGGCPFCKMRARLEKRFAEYITGPAMMEPDVRVKTNEKGFCRRHYDMTTGLKNRLAVALMLQTRLERLIEDVNKGASGRPGFKKEEAAGESCFICENVHENMLRLMGNTIVLWARDDAFKKLYESQEYICVDDFKRVTEIAKAKLRGADRQLFISVTKKLCEKQLIKLKAGIDAFCGLFDYRSVKGEAPGEEVSEAIENAVGYLKPF